MRWLEVLAIVLTSSSAALAEAAPEKLLLQDLVPQGVEAADAAALSSAACHALSGKKDIELLCGDDLRALMQWNAVLASLDACRDEACRTAAARGLDARLVVSGSVSKVGAGYVLTLSLLDTALGQARGRAEVKASSIEALHGQLPEAFSQLFLASKASKKP